MAFTNKLLDVLKNCYLIKPVGDRCRDFYCLWRGEVTEVDPDNRFSGLAAIYVRKNFEDGLFSLVKEVEIELKKNRIFGASPPLAEAAIILNIAYRQTKKVPLLEEMLNSYADVEVTTFVGLPNTVVFMSDPMNFMTGIPLGRFMLGGPANIRHRQLFGNQEAAVPDEQEDTLHKVGAWIMREPVNCRVLRAAFDDALSSHAREPCSIEYSKLIIVPTIMIDAINNTM